MTMKLPLSLIVIRFAQLLTLLVIAATIGWLALTAFQLQTKLRCFELTRTQTSTTGTDKTWTVQEVRANQAAFDECLKLSR